MRVAAPRAGVAAGRGVPPTDACTRTGWRALRVLEIRRNGAHRSGERTPVLQHDRAEGRSIGPGGRRCQHRSVLDIRRCARGPTKSEVAERDLPEGMTLQYSFYETQIETNVSFRCIRMKRRVKCATSDVRIIYMKASDGKL